MKRKLLSTVCFSVIIGFICSFVSAAKAMEIVKEDEQNTPIQRVSATEMHQREQREKTEVLAKNFLSTPPEEMNEDDARVLIDWASLPTLEKLFLLENKNSTVLKQRCFTFDELTNKPGYKSCFELVRHLYSNHIGFTEDEKNEFLTHFTSGYGDAILFFCEKDKAYIDFFKANKSILLDATRGYMMRHKAACFWSAWVDYIEPKPTQEQLEKAAFANHEEAKTQGNQPHFQEMFAGRAVRYYEKAGIRNGDYAHAKRLAGSR